MGKKECSIASISTCPHNFFFKFSSQPIPQWHAAGEKTKENHKDSLFLTQSFSRKTVLQIFNGLPCSHLSMHFPFSFSCYHFSHKQQKTKTTSIRKTPSISNATLPQVCSMTQGAVDRPTTPPPSLLSVTFSFLSFSSNKQKKKHKHF